MPLLQIAVFPLLERVFDVHEDAVERGFKIVALLRLSDCAAESELLRLQYFHALPKLVNDRRTVCHLDFVHEGFDLPVQIVELLLAILPDGRHGQKPAVELFEQIVFHHREDGGTRFKFGQMLLELCVYLLCRDALVVRGAALLHAAVVRVVVFSPLGEAAGVGMMALGAEEEPAKWEILPRILAGSLCLLLQSPQDALVGLGGDQGLMVSLALRDAPFGERDEARVEIVGEQMPHLIEMQESFELRCPEFLLVEERLDFELIGELSSSESFQCLSDDRGLRFVWDEDLPMTGDTGEDVTHRRTERPVARFHSGFHAVLRLPPVGIALVLGSCGENGFREFALRGFVEGVDGTFDHSAQSRELLTDMEVGDHIASKALQIVHDDDVLISSFPFTFQEVQQFRHARTLEVSAGDALVPKDLLHIMPFRRGELAGMALLPVEAVTVRDLAIRRHPAVDERFHGRGSS